MPPRQIRIKRSNSPRAQPPQGITPDYFARQPLDPPGHLRNLAGPIWSKPGVRGFPGLDPGQVLLAEVLQKHRVKGPVLDLTAMGGLLAHLPGVELRAVEGSAAALSVLTSSGLNPVAAIPGDELLSRWPDRAKVVTTVLAGDRGSAYVEAQLSWAHTCTPPGGQLYLAGDKEKGFDRYVRWASQAFGTGETIARDGGQRVALLTRRPGPTPPFPAPSQFEARGLKVTGLPGVFSAAKLDQASDLLLSVLEQQPYHWPESRVLDLGCGTGILGAWAASRGAQTTLLDGDLNSVRSSLATLQANGLSGQVLHSDVGSALNTETFDLILSNPPFHVGKGMVLDVAREFIAAAGRHLKPGGALILVANHFLPYEPLLARWGTVEALRLEQGFKVLRCSAPQ